MTRRSLIFAILALILLVPILSACAPAGQPAASTDYIKKMKMAPMAGMPDEVKKSALNVQQAYQFAVANPDVLKQVPCYCGCGSMGHTSNYACYVKSDADGKVTYDLHATGCSICVDITHDTMRMLAQGKPIQEIKAQIDKTYSQYGPSNMSK